MAAFVSGGLIPTQIRGGRTNATVHICDWFVTFSNLAGATLPKPRAGVPPIDSLDVWSAITSAGKIASPRHEVPLSSTALIIGDHKLVMKAPTGGKDTWQNPMYPEGSTTPGDGCDSTAAYAELFARFTCSYGSLAKSKRHGASLSQPSPGVVEPSGYIGFCQLSFPPVGAFITSLRSPIINAVEDSGTS